MGTPNNRSGWCEELGSADIVGLVMGNLEAPKGSLTNAEWAEILSQLAKRYSHLWKYLPGFSELGEVINQIAIGQTSTGQSASETALLPQGIEAKTLCTPTLQCDTFPDGAPQNSDESKTYHLTRILLTRKGEWLFLDITAKTTVHVSVVGTPSVSSVSVVKIDNALWKEMLEIRPWVGKWIVEQLSEMFSKWIEARERLTEQAQWAHHDIKEIRKRVMA